MALLVSRSEHDRMKTFFILLFSGLALGAVYSLVALGFVVIYRSSQVFNFAHGEFLAFGAFLMASLTSTDAPIPCWLARFARWSGACRLVALAALETSTTLGL